MAGDILISGNFNVNVGKPIDARSQVADLTARDAIPVLQRWEGMTVFVVSEGKLFIISGDLSDNGNWAEVGAGAGGGGGDFDDSDYAYTGYSDHFKTMFNSTDLDDTLKKMIQLSYAPPTVSFTASGSGTIREFGENVTSVNLTASYSVLSDPVTKVEFFYDNNSVEVDNSPSSPVNYGWTGSFNTNKTFKVEVTDDGSSSGNAPQTVTKTANFEFVYPYYQGTGAAGADGTAIKGMTKEKIKSTATKKVTYTIDSGDYYYFAYPKTYGALSEIIDENDFNVTNAFTQRTVSITGLDGNPVDYYVYESNSAAANGVTTYFTFKR